MSSSCDKERIQVKSHVLCTHRDNQAHPLALDLNSELDTLHAEAHSLLEMVQDDAATSLGSGCATQ